MFRLINRLKLIFLGIFAMSSVAIATYHGIWVWPAQRCEARGAWWDNATRTCATPVPLYVLTGRGPGGKPTSGSASGTHPQAPKRHKAE